MHSFGKEFRYELVVCAQKTTQKFRPLLTPGKWSEKK